MEEVEKLRKQAGKSYRVRVKKRMGEYYEEKPLEKLSKAIWKKPNMFLNAKLRLLREKQKTAKKQLMRQHTVETEKMR